FDRAGIFQLGVTEEFGAAVNFQTFAVIAGKVASGAGHFPLFVHGGVKAVFVNFQVAFTGHVGSEVKRETVGVVEFEGGFTGNGVAFQTGNGFIQNAHAFIQGFGELLFFQ